MNQEDIINMAIEVYGSAHEDDFKFASLVAAAKCKELADQIDQMPFGDTAASFAVWIREQA